LFAPRRKTLALRKTPGQCKGGAALKRPQGRLPPPCIPPAAAWLIVPRPTPPPAALWYARRVLGAAT